MKQVSSTFLSNIKESVRELAFNINVYNPSMVSKFTLNKEDIYNININKSSQSKVFGYSISSSITVEQIENSQKVIEKGDILKVNIGCGNELVSYPYFYVTGITEDKVNKKVKLEGYDIINNLSDYQWKDLSLSYPITVQGLVSAINSQLGFNIAAPSIDLTLNEAPSFDAAATIRSVVERVAELDGNIVVSNGTNVISFVTPFGGTSVLNIGKGDYYSFEFNDVVEVTQITAINELGDAVSVGTTDGFEITIRDNPFFVQLDDATIQDILNNLNIDYYVYPYSMKWRGNPALEVGDTVTIDDGSGASYVTMILDESISYNGGLTVDAKYQKIDNDDSEQNPSSIGEIISLTSAKVDKANNVITLVAQKVDEQSVDLETVTQRTDNLSSTVEGITDDLDEFKDDINTQMTEISTKTALQLTPEDVEIAIEKRLTDGITEVTTTTGFKFDEDGLNISKSNSDINTTITENGMKISKNSEDVLVANNNGVDAFNLHAKTYLIIGNNIRLEDWEGGTGCFWIG